MGMIKDAKADLLRKDAQSAWDSGTQYFTPLLNLPTTRHTMSGRISDWEPMLDAVTSVGWKLHTWAVCSDNRGNPQGMPLFVRG